MSFALVLSVSAVRWPTRRVGSGERRHGSRPGAAHSRYERRVADEPISGRPVEIHLQIRRFRCPNLRCPRQTFAEQVPHLVERRARW
ncbi:MAG: transposase family protein, partial [Chloroflexi bacterium]|nr:transposase family protein [Chloroflexota bacterium]